MTNRRARWMTAALAAALSLTACAAPAAVRVTEEATPLAAAAAETDPAVTWLAAVGAGWLTWRGMVLVLKLDEPRRKRGVRR